MLENLYILENRRKGVKSGKLALIMLTRRGQLLMRQVGMMAFSISCDKHMLISAWLLANHVRPNTFLTLLRLVKQI